MQYLLSFPFSIAIFKKIVAYHLQDVAIINRSVCWLMVAFLKIETFSKLPLLSDQVDDGMPLWLSTEGELISNWPALGLELLPQHASS